VPPKLSSLAVEQRRAQHVVAHTADGRSRRATQAGGDHAADGPARAETRRLERQALALLGQRGLQRRKRCAGTHRDHQLRRLVGADAGQRGDVERLALWHFAVEGLGVAAADVQRGFLRPRGLDLVDQALQRRVTHQ
jgi:hypothetical protein